MGKRGNPNWGSGVSGNPGGRPKLEGEVRSLAQAHTAEAVERLAFWMRSDNAKASVAASLGLLDRGWGRAPQALSLTGSLSVGLSELVKKAEESRGLAGEPSQP